MTGKTTGQKLIYIGGFLLLLGGIGSNPNILLGGIGGWVLMVAGFGVMLFGVVKRASERKNQE